MLVVPTCKQSRRDFPKALHINLKINLPAERHVARGYYKYLCKDSMVASAWYDRRYVHFLSTAHPPCLPDGSFPTTQRKDGAQTVNIECSPCLEDYISNMRGVDLGDQLISLYNAGQRGKKAWRCIM